MLRLAFLLLASILLPFRGATAALEAGELLVSHGDRIFRVDPVTGARAVFSPPPLGTNLLDAFGTDAIAIDPDGPIFVVSDDLVISIDPATGSQDEVMARALVCIPTCT